MMCNGALAGCVAITASGAYVPHWAAIVIGIIASVITRFSLHFIENKLKIDDPVGGHFGSWSKRTLGTPFRRYLFRRDVRRGSWPDHRLRVAVTGAIYRLCDLGRRCFTVGFAFSTPSNVCSD